MVKLLIDEDDTMKTASKKLDAAKSKEEQRQIEMKYLKPEKIPEYKGKKPMMTTKRRSVTLIFRSDEEIDMFERHFSISSKSDRTANDIRPIVAFLKELDNGSIKYDREQDCLKFQQG